VKRITADQKSKATGGPPPPNRGSGRHAGDSQRAEFKWGGPSDFVVVEVKQKEWIEQHHNLQRHPMHQLDQKSKHVVAKHWVVEGREQASANIYLMTPAQHRALPKVQDAASPRYDPTGAAVLIRLFCAPAEREAILLDLEEMYERDLSAGRRAVALYWANVARSVLPLAWNAVRRIGLVGMVLGAFKRFVG
jgi:hypothetical protein